MSLTLDVDKVAAYWTEGQVVSGTLALTNTSQDQVNFTLQTASSHYHFDAELTDAPAIDRRGRDPLRARHPADRS